MSECSQQLELIRQCYRAHDLDEEGIFYITRKLLEHYRNAIWMNGVITGEKNSILQNEGKEEVRKWYLGLKDLTKEQMEDTSVDSMIFHICRTDWILRVINVVMERVKIFHITGGLYYEILNKAFFSKDMLSEDEIAEELCLARSTYYRRKREAILLCGVLLWEEASTRKFA